MNYFFYLISLLCLKRVYCRMEEKIVGGDYARIRNFPHAVYLSALCPETPDVTWICGSSILNQNIVVTAAHCLYGCKPRGGNDVISAYAGHENINKVKVVRNVVGLVVHASYDDTSYANDIGLAAVAKPFPFGLDIKRVIIPKNFGGIMYSSALAGWGVINEDTDEVTILLKSVSQRIRNKSACSVLGYLEPGMFCAGSNDAKAGRPAGGDSGSGLVSRDFQLGGILSFKKPRFPALLVYTNATYYYRWIEHNTKRLFCYIS